jgi:hypothetical protein
MYKDEKNYYVYGRYTVGVSALLFPLMLETCMYINTSHTFVQHSISDHQVCNTTSRINIVN